MEQPYYLKKIKEDFSKRQKLNSSYSLRAYARDLEMPPSTLSHVLLGNRPLPLKNFNHVIERMRLSPKERTIFFDSLGKNHTSLDKIILSHKDDRFILDETYHQIIAEWEHYAALMLFDCDDLEEVNQKTIQERLNITKLRAEVVVDNLKKYGMVVEDEDQKLIRTHSKFRSTEDVASLALRSSHLENLGLAEKKLEEVAIELRDFSSLMVALDLEKIPEAKIIIREFRQKLMSLLESGHRTDVYQMAIQFYPLTAVRREKLNTKRKSKKENFQ